MPELVFDDVDIRYRLRGEDGAREVHAVKGASLRVPAGGTLGIAGESGSGKSTLAMSVLRLLPRNARVSGRILLGDRDLLTLGWGALRAVRWREASIVFQGAMHSLNPVRDVGRQITEALRMHTTATPAECARRVGRLLAQVDLPERVASSFPHELSGGQKQRVMIAMALACEPQLIIADEPTTALDVVVQAQVLELLGGLVAERGISLVMISHDLSVLAKSCERIAVMYGGEVVEEGPAAEVMGSPRHPHTRALAAAFPVIGDPASRLNPVSVKARSETDAAADVAPRADEAPGDVLAADRVGITFRTRKGPVVAVDDVSFACRSGEITALVGQSGSGKTTLARLMLGLETPQRGQVLFQGAPLGRRREELRRFRREVQLVLQDPYSALNPKSTVYEAVAEGIRIHRLPGDEQERVRRALEQVELLPVDRFLTAIPQELSGGQLQRAVIAGALALEPSFLVADEPVASLDASLRGEILALIMDLRRRLGLGALVITHDLGVAWNIADRVLVMHRGRIVEEGTTEAVLLDPHDDYTKRLLAAVPSGVVPR